MDQPQADQQSVSRQELSPEPTSSSPNDSAPDASPGSRRFKVAQVQFDTPSPRQTMDGSQPAGRGVNSPVVESPSPSHQASMFDVTATIGYATNEAVPMTVFYRDGGPDRARPTLQALRKGFEADQDQESTDVTRTPSNVENGTFDGDKTEPKVVKAAPKFGWMKGVMFRCLLNIWGVMLYLRLTWVVGQSGIGWSTAIILLSALVTVVTTMSMSAVCTNGEVKGGGAYFLISRSLGPEFGGSIGLIFSVANAVAVALYVVGFAETVRDMLKEYDALMIDEVNDIRIIGILTVLLLLGVTLIGLEWVVRTQMFLLVILIISIVDAIIGTFIGPQNELSKAQGFTGYSLNLFSKNFGPDYRGNENFFSVFAVFFPAATGILAGVNISGDLKDAQKAIPKGTLIAIVLSTIVYVLLAWMAGACVERDASGIIFGLLNSSMNSTASTNYCASNECSYGLLHDYQVMEKISAFGPIITAGIFAATLSSALASLVGAPKTFQALCKDEIFPYIGCFGVGVGPGEEPRRGYILTFLVAGSFIAIGELNVIAPVISNFFLMSYALINYAVFAASLGRSPGWRPSFKYYNQWVSLIGALMCVAIMFLINWWAALVTIVIVVALYKYVDAKKLPVNWGSSAQALTFTQALRFAYRLNHVAYHVKNFRPLCLALTGKPSLRPQLAHLVSQLTRSAGLMVCGEVRVTEKVADARDYEDRWLKENKIRAFHSICAAPSLRAGVRIMLQTVGLGKLRPNTLVLGYKKNWARESSEAVEEYVKVVQDAFELNYGVAILRVPERNLDFDAGAEDPEDDWLSDEEAVVTSEKARVEQADPEGGGEAKDYFTDQTPTEARRKFTVERAASPVARLSDSWGTGKSQSDCRTWSSSSLSAEKRTIDDSEINFLEASTGRSDAGDDVKDSKSAQGEGEEGEAEARLGRPGDAEAADAVADAEATSFTGSPVFRPKDHENVDSVEVEGERHGDERAKLLEAEVVPVTFQEKQEGSIDVWWLFDDGGLTVLMPYLLSQHRHWRGCKLRILSPAREGLKTNEVRMVNLMKKFRIDISSVVSVAGINRRPTNESIQDFLKLPVQNEFPSVEDLLKDKKTLRHIRLGEMLHEHSSEARLIVITLPVPREAVTSGRLYMSWLEMLSVNLPPVLLVRGNHESVLTFYC